MLTRLAFFEGAIRLGWESQFEDYVKTKLLPIWRQTPRAMRVDVLREVEADDGAFVSRWYWRLRVQIETQPDLRPLALSKTSN